MNDITRKRKSHLVEIVSRDYQPSKAGLEGDARFDGAFEEAVDALCQPVQIHHINKPE